VKKKVPVVSVAGVETANLAGLPLEATVVLADLAGAVQEGLLGFCADVGLMVMAQMLDAEMTARVGPKHAKIGDRQANWHGTATGPVVLGGRQVSVSRPRGRTVEGGEIDLDAWQAFSSRDLLDRVTVERMLSGWPPAATWTWPNRPVLRWKRRPRPPGAARSDAGSSGPPRPPWPSCWPGTCRGWMWR
jgi:hypothetical protein